MVGTSKKYRKDVKVDFGVFLAWYEIIFNPKDTPYPQNTDPRTTFVGVNVLANMHGHDNQIIESSKMLW